MPSAHSLHDLSYSAAKACKEIPVSHMQCEGEAKVPVGSVVKEKGQAIGKIVNVQPGFNVGFAHIQEFEAVKDPWTIDDEWKCLPVLPFCDACYKQTISLHTNSVLHCSPPLNPLEEGA